MATKLKKQRRRTGEFTAKRKCTMKLLPESVRWAMDTMGLTKEQVYWLVYYSADSAKNMEKAQKILDYNNKVLEDMIVLKASRTAAEEKFEQTRRLLNEANAAFSQKN